MCSARSSLPRTPGSSEEVTCLVPHDVRATRTDRVGDDRDEIEAQRLIREAVRNTRAQRALVRALRPFVLVHVRYMLRRWPARRIGGMDQDDLVNEIFEALFADEGRLLQAYDPSRGTLQNYVSAVAFSRMRDLERRELRRSELFPPPQPLDQNTIENVGQNDAPPDELVIWAQYARLLRDCLNKKFTTSKAREMVRLLYDLGMSTDEIESMGIARPAIFRWRSAILNAARECLKILDKRNRGLNP